MVCKNFLHFVSYMDADRVGNPIHRSVYLHTQYENKSQFVFQLIICILKFLMKLNFSVY
jgi:hypothetical protein